MKFICKADFEINGILVGKQDDILEITDAVPNATETADDVNGYMYIHNMTTDKIFEATWMDITDDLVVIDY